VASKYIYTDSLARIYTLTVAVPAFSKELLVAQFCYFYYRQAIIADIDSVQQHKVAGQCPGNMKQIIYLAFIISPLILIGCT
jgi:hypothetical protein